MHEAIGNMQTLDDRLDPSRAAAMHATLGLPGEAPASGCPLPPFWHQIYFWPVLPDPSLEHDGHPRTGSGLIPDLGLPHRMWAGGRLKFRQPVIIGHLATKTAIVEDISFKTGRTGPLAFVTLRHEISQEGKVCVTEHQDIVYREPPKTRSTVKAPVAANDETLSKTAKFSSTLLFRYSALTFNGHRIHYDLDYSRNVEGYSGLVVHGPLLAQVLLQFAARQIDTLSKFSFRATSALMHEEVAELCWKEDGTLWVRGPDGRLCMQAEAS